jgi:hypothetical protein
MDPDIFIQMGIIMSVPAGAPIGSENLLPSFPLLNCTCLSVYL